MYAQVVVLTYQPPEIDSYTYLVPKSLEKDLKVGMLVKIPFGTRSPFGIVVGTNSNIRNLPFDKKLAQGKQLEIRNLKKISGIFFSKPLLLPYQIELLKWMSFYYHAPMVNCLEAMLPGIPKQLSGEMRGVAPVKGFQTAQSKGTESNQADFISKRALTGHQRRASTPSAGKLATGPRALQITGPVLHQTLILIPSINRLPEIMSRFTSAKNYAVYHNELTTSQKFATWLRILSGQANFIFGSRLAIFTPCPNLEKIIIFDEHEGTYKDNRSPYFDTLTVAEKLIQITGTKLQIIDSSPKVSTYFAHKNGIQIPQFMIRTQIVSMTDERKKGNRLAISDLLLDQLKKTIARGQSSLLFLNKKKESGQVYCRNCRYQEFVQKQPETCSNCQSQDIFFSSLNIYSLAATVKKILQNATINMIAEGAKVSNYPTIQSPASTATRFDARRERGEPIIDIATASVFYSLVPQKYDLVAHILTDSTLNVADFNSAEKTFHQITSLKKLTKKNGQIILQTYNENHPVVKAAAKSNYATYFASQLPERKALADPPFALLIKLTLKGKPARRGLRQQALAGGRLEVLEKKAEELVRDLKSLSPHQTGVWVLGPYQPVFGTKVPIYNIILKYRLTDYSLAEKGKAIKNLKPYLEKVPRDWQTVVEPASLN